MHAQVLQECCPTWCCTVPFAATAGLLGNKITRYIIGSLLASVCRDVLLTAVAAVKVPVAMNTLHMSHMHRQVCRVMILTRIRLRHRLLDSSNRGHACAQSTSSVPSDHHQDPSFLVSASAAKECFCRSPDTLIPTTMLRQRCRCFAAVTFCLLQLWTAAAVKFDPCSEITGINRVRAREWLDLCVQ